MHAHRPDILRDRFVNHAEQMIDMRMHIPIGKQPHEVQRSARCLPLNHRLPSAALENAAVFHGFIHQLGALCKNTSRPERVVPDFAIPHVIIGGKSYGCSVKYGEKTVGSR